MNIPSWIYDPWFISIATVIITLLAEPLLAFLVTRFRSWRGSFTGTYLELTMQQDAKSAVVEVVKCQHVGDKIRANIKGIAFVELKDDKLIELANNEGRYKVSGNVDERVLVLSYYTTNRGAKGSGTMILKADSSGRVFKGVWAGFDEDKVVSSMCIWIRINDKLSTNRSNILEEAKKILFIERSLFKNNETLTPPVKQNSSVFIGNEQALGEIHKVIENEQDKSNPYLIYLAGHGGLGKTHLLQALLKNNLQSNPPNTSLVQTRKDGKSNLQLHPNQNLPKKTKKARRKRG